MSNRLLCHVFFGIALCLFWSSAALVATEAKAQDRTTSATTTSATARFAIGSVVEGKLRTLNDGDSFEVTTESGTIRVRLAGIDAPERHQAFAAQARSKMQSLLQGKTLRIQVQKLDQYQRYIAQVWIKQGKHDVDAGLEMLNAGLAWHYKRYAKEQDFDTRLAYTRSEETARAARVGIWSRLDSETPPQAPWEFRKERR